MINLIVFCENDNLGKEIINYYKSNKNTNLYISENINLNNLTEVYNYLIKFKNIENLFIINCIDSNVSLFNTSDKEYIYNINVSNNIRLILISKIIKAKFIYFSSVFVFDGEKNEFYEDDTPSPKSFFGQTKKIVEDIILNFLEDYYILRIGWIYGKYDYKLSKFNNIINALKTRKKIFIDNWQKINPLPTLEVVKQMDYIINNCNKGIYHITTNNFCTYYEFGKYLENIYNLNNIIFPKGTNIIENEKIIKNAILKNTKIDTKLFKSDWKEILNDYIKNNNFLGE